MKITSEQVITRIANIEEKFKELQKKYLIGFKTDLIENKLDRYLLQSISVSIYIIWLKIKFESFCSRQNLNCKFIFCRKGHVLDSIIIQIKILMDIPQYIWRSIENQNLLFATQLYIIAQYINYSLMFEVGSTELSNKYPIVLKQWDVIMQFKTIISNECNKILQSLDVSAIVGIQIINYFSHLNISY